MARFSGLYSDPAMNSRKGYEATAIRCCGSEGNCKLGAELARARAGPTHAPAVAAAPCIRNRLRVVVGKLVSLAWLCHELSGAGSAGEGARATQARITQAVQRLVLRLTKGNHDRNRFRAAAFGHFSDDADAGGRRLAHSLRWRTQGRHR